MRLEDLGEIQATYDAVDWASTPVGDPSTWSTALDQAFVLMMQTDFPTCLFWGPELVLIYNNAFSVVIGDKHPTGLGGSAEVVFAEAWEQISVLFQQVMSGGDSVYIEDALIPLDRVGFLEESYFTFSYSAVASVEGEIEGVIDITYETTPQVLAARRTQFISVLRSALNSVDRREDLAGLVYELLQTDHPDLSQVDLRDKAHQRLSQGLIPAAPQGPLSGVEPRVEEVDGKRVVWLPLREPDEEWEDPPVLVVAVSPMLPVDDAYLQFLGDIAASLTQTLDRLEIRELELRVTEAERSLSESLQRSLLTEPVQVEDLQVAVRYLPAVDSAQVGGDWYDAFRDGVGALTVTIGDVTGHDREAAAGMAQIRNMLRALAFSSTSTPAQVMSALDRAVVGLGMGTLATTVIARIDDPDDGGSRHRRVRWCNAGHIPPLMVTAEGEVIGLTSEPGTMLGVAPEIPRRDQVIDLPEGSSLLMITDGLIERRDLSMEESLRRLSAALREGRHLDPESLADHLLDAFPDDIDDDVALLVLRAGAPTPAASPTPDTPAAASR